MARKKQLTKQVSWMAARAINNRFRGLFGYSADDEEGFPSPADVAQKDVLVLKSAGLSLRKAEYGEYNHPYYPYWRLIYSEIIGRAFLIGRIVDRIAA
jgi:hypothetical protein